MWRKLKALQEKKTRHDSHLCFRKASPRNNITLRGMMIRISPQAKDVDQRLKIKWRKIIHRAEIQPLKALKVHYRDISSGLQ